MQKTKIYTASYGEIPRDSFLKLSKFRYCVFIERLKWNIPTTDHFNKLEIDQYDTKDAYYTIAEEANGNIIGCSRLIPSSKPYLLSEHFDFLCIEELPFSYETWEYETWEVSRFAVDSPFDKTLPIKIFKQALAYAWSRGARSVVAVTTMEMERYFKRNNISTRRMGDPITKDGDNLIALMFTNIYRYHIAHVDYQQSHLHNRMLCNDARYKEKTRISV
ncbi:GNAT family N-acetyltransferase [Halomonas sp. McH1-25]|uniref:acyl-homoserine-lactone synthase n=1 Tax=unclassified Halomonas TaxID=2609666 RepID=UPI001EF61784|nr:GNAT family N-acetyltransferase [Halomonas sp. McH1-25]MCP1344245.1 GNAT family N-acetyltransferase [Halomonas sp. FL8]MCP1363160.1 GNAT family N-acetyltransferase [Halomonas sp. BBD45]MCP1364145.1 GNAT family N-acetyltransferase [Halomonas sp. BBD48]